jgi:hypothetical protein
LFPELFHHITVFLISEEEKALFLEAGVVFQEITRGLRGESASFDIGDGDPRWERVVALIASLEERDGMPKKLRVQDLAMTVPMEEAIRRTKERVAAYVKSRPGPAWLDGYSGQSAGQLLMLEGKYRTDSIVLAFEEAIRQKAEREGAEVLTDVERIVLAVQALEREVNNGGYHQFFVNSSREFAPTIVSSLQRIGCKKTASITQRAITALGASSPTLEMIDDVLAEDNQRIMQKLTRCDDAYYKSAEPIADRLFSFIRANEKEIKLQKSNSKIL